MPAGRPSKYREEYISGDKLIKSNFLNEKELENYIEKNIKEIFFTITGKEYKKHIRQYSISRYANSISNRSISNARADFFIEDIEEKKYIIEVKHPKNSYGNLQGITQLLFYKSLLKNLLGKNIIPILLSTLCDKYIGTLIKEYNFPIIFVIIKKDKVFIFQDHIFKEY